MSGIVDADLQRDPQAQQALLALLGTTHAHLKEIDRNIVGSSSNIQSKLNVNQIIGDLRKHVQQPSSPVNVQPPPVSVPVPQPIPVAAAPVHAVPVDSELSVKMDKILEKLDTIIKCLEAK